MPTRTSMGSVLKIITKLPIAAPATTQTAPVPSAASDSSTPTPTVQGTTSSDAFKSREVNALPVQMGSPSATTYVL